MVLDAEDKVIYANAALSEMFSIPRAGIIGKRPLEIIRLVELTELVDAAKKTNAVQEKEMQLVYPREKALLGAAYLVRGGEFSGVAVLIRDISEMKRLENLRREFVANVSHELKTPLTAIRSYTETLIQGAMEDKQNNRKFLDKIDTNARGLSALIDDILEISRMEARRGVAPFEPVSLKEETARALETLADRAREKNIEIEPNLSDCRVMGEAAYIYRALLNLLDNAIKYSPAGGTIEIGCRQTGNEIYMSVKDYGSGIPEEHQERVFERFYRVDKARSRELGGTGLGLSIVKHIMEIHGGRVELESEEGKGAKFTLIFPA